MPYKNSEERLLYVKNHYLKNREKYLEFSRIRFRESSQEKKLLISAKQRASKFSIPFNITIDDIVIPDLCPILKQPLIPKTRYAPSLDRLIPEKGYVKGNVWVISNKANSMKNDANKEDLERFSEWLKIYLR